MNILPAQFDFKNLEAPPRSAEVINFPSDFAGQIWHVERKPQRGIWQAAA